MDKFEEAEHFQHTLMRATAEETVRLVGKHGPDVLEAPRWLAVCHEVGHAVVGAMLGIGISRVEVFLTKVPRAERRLIVALGGKPLRRWGGFTTYKSNPFGPPGSAFDPRDLPKQVFEAHVRMTIAGLCGELEFYDKEVPEASSLNEVVAAQAACYGRTLDHAVAATLFHKLYCETRGTLGHYKAATSPLFEVFRRRDVVSGRELAECLSGIPVFKEESNV